MGGGNDSIEYINNKNYLAPKFEKIPLGNWEIFAIIKATSIL